MSTLTAPGTAQFLLNSMNRALDYAQLLVKDIPAEKFAFMPHDGMNHPAFCIGHLSLYPNRLLALVGRKDLVVEKPRYAELFQAGAACVQQDGRYPVKDELVAYFLERYRAVGKLLPEISDETFANPNPMEGRMRELFPRIGDAFAFMLGTHLGMHLGQISAWRRAIGLGPAM